MRRRMDTARAGDAGVVVRSGNTFAEQNSHNNDETQFALGADGCGVQIIRVELSELHRRSGDTVPVAACHLATVESASSPVCKLARELLRLGVDARIPLSIWRGGMQCFLDAPVGRWAELTVEESGAGPVFRRHRPSFGAVDASQGALSDD